MIGRVTKEYCIHVTVEVEAEDGEGAWVCGITVNEDTLPVRRSKSFIERMIGTLIDEDEIASSVIRDLDILDGMRDEVIADARIHEGR